VTVDKIKPIWKRAESIQPLTEMQTVQTGVNAGIPTETMLKWVGKTEKELEGMATDKMNKIMADQEDTIPEVEQ
jgi:hypothetical protein